MGEGKVLVVDDDPDVRTLVGTILADQGFSVEYAADGHEALRQVGSFLPDVMVLDVAMPGLDGLTVCREVRRTSQLPILMLSARGDELDRVLGLEIGADDYLVKPFSQRELVARVRTMFRRLRALPSAADDDILLRGIVKIHVSHQRVEVKGENVPLTALEFNLLKALAVRPGVVMSRQDLLDRVWGEDYVGDERTVDTHVRRVRQKLQKAWPGCQYLVSVWGVGYKFEAPATAGAG